MAVQRVENINDYVRIIENSPEEVEALFQDLLIGVTRFFRDEEAFKALEEVTIPQLIKSKKSGESIRIWVPGCSTGEEAYTLAILFREAFDHFKSNFQVQIFATDIDLEAIAIARMGVYSKDIAEKVSKERLQRFFTLQSDNERYIIHKNIRDMLIFSEQNVIKDPPFSKLDLISCRNMLIYMDGDLQKKSYPCFIML